MKNIRIYYLLLIRFIYISLCHQTSDEISRERIHNRKQRCDYENYEYKKHNYIVLSACIIILADEVPSHFDQTTHLYATFQQF